MSSIDIVNIGDDVQLGAVVDKLLLSLVDSLRVN